MKITQITDEHLINRIKFFERKLADRPPYACYVGDSDYASDAVDMENRHNDELFEAIQSHVKYMKSEARKRGLSLSK